MSPVVSELSWPPSSRSLLWLFLLLSALHAHVPGGGVSAAVIRSTRKGVVLASVSLAVDKSPLVSSEHFHRRLRRHYDHVLKLSPIAAVEPLLPQEPMRSTGYNVESRGDFGRSGSRSLHVRRNVNRPTFDVDSPTFIAASRRSRRESGARRIVDESATGSHVGRQRRSQSHHHRKQNGHRFESDKESRFDNDLDNMIDHGPEQGVRWKYKSKTVAGKHKGHTDEASAGDSRSATSKKLDEDHHPASNEKDSGNNDEDDNRNSDKKDNDNKDEGDIDSNGKESEGGNDKEENDNNDKEDNSNNDEKNNDDSDEEDNNNNNEDDNGDSDKGDDRTNNKDDNRNQEDEIDETDNDDEANANDNRNKEDSNANGGDTDDEDDEDNYDDDEDDGEYEEEDEFEDEHEEDRDP